jgi:hypothetical protein
MNAPPRPRACVPLQTPCLFRGSRRPDHRQSADTVHDDFARRNPVVGLVSAGPHRHDSTSSGALLSPTGPASGDERTDLLDELVFDLEIPRRLGHIDREEQVRKQQGLESCRCEVFQPLANTDADYAVIG